MYNRLFGFKITTPRKGVDLYILNKIVPKHYLSEMYENASLTKTSYHRVSEILTLCNFDNNCIRKEGNVLFNNALNTFYLRLYGVRHMVKDHSNSEKGNPLPPQDSTYHGLCYTSRGSLAATRNSSMGPLHEGSIRRPIPPWANALTTELHLATLEFCTSVYLYISKILNKYTVTKQWKHPF